MVNWKELKTGREPVAKVSIEDAKALALFEVRKNWAEDVHGFRELGGASLEDEPLIIYDLNGKALFYEFELKTGKAEAGLVKASASKAIGTPAIQIQLTPRNWDPEVAYKKANEQVKDLYPKAKVLGAELVCYSYPKIGVRVTIDDPKEGKGTLIFDVSSFSLVDRFGEDELEGFTSWSFYDQFILPEAAKREERYNAFERAFKAMGPQAKGKIMEPLTAGDQKEVKKAFLEGYKDKIARLDRPVAPIIPIPATSQRVIKYGPHCTTHDCWKLLAQQTNVYCAVATGQMILDFYRYYYSQADIAVAMGTGAGGTSNDGQAQGYKKLSNYCLEPTIDLTADWAEAKAEIDANRPLKSGIPGHARACFGWKRANLWIAGKPRPQWLYILDPWPWNADICKGGAEYWEDWYAVSHTNFIYVRHRTTPCK